MMEKLKEKMGNKRKEHTLMMLLFLFFFIWSNSLFPLSDNTQQDSTITQMSENFQDKEKNQEKVQSILRIGPRVGHTGYAEQIGGIYIEGEKFIGYIFDPFHGFGGGLQFSSPYKEGSTLFELYWGDRAEFYVDGELVGSNGEANPHSGYSTGPGEVIVGAREDNYGGLKEFWKGKVLYYKNLCTGTEITTPLTFDGEDDFMVVDETDVDEYNRPYYPAGGIILKIYISPERVITIDPGHGKYKYLGSVYWRGAVGPTYGDKEDDLALDMGMKLKEKLEDEYKINMIRSTEWDILPDCAIGIENPPTPDTPVAHNNACVNRRVKKANKFFHELIEKLKNQGIEPIKAEEKARKRMVFVSIHCNSCIDKAVGGTEILYFEDSDNPERTRLSISLAKHILDKVVSIAGLNKHREGIVKANKAVIHYTKMPAVIVETAFLSNCISDTMSNETFLHYSEYRNLIVEAIAEGIKEYFKELEKEEE